jgi:hypothetical protein
MIRPLSPRATPRRGVATVEVVMCLPVLVGLFACILQVGATVSAEAEVVAEARHLAWAQREGSVGAVPFEFETPNPVDGSAHRSARVSPIFRGFPEPRSRHTVLAGAWDDRQVNLGRQPNWELDAKLVPEGKVMQVQNASSDLQLFKSLGEKALQSFFDNELAGYGGKLFNIQDLLATVQGKGEAQQQKSAGLFQTKRDKWKEDMRQTRDDIEVINQKIIEKEARVKEIEEVLQDDDKADKKNQLKEDERKKLEDVRRTILDKDLPALKKDLEARKKTLKGLDDALRNVDRYTGQGQ